MTTAATLLAAREACAKYFDACCQAGGGDADDDYDAIPKALAVIRDHGAALSAAVDCAEALAALVDFVAVAKDDDAVPQWEQACIAREKYRAQPQSMPTRGEEP